jgi:hypothetical protein
MTGRTYVIRKGIEGIIAPLYGESFQFFDTFQKRTSLLPKEAYPEWKDVVDFFNELLKTSDNDVEKYLYKIYLLPVTYHAIPSRESRNYSIANEFMVVRFIVTAKERVVEMRTMKQATIKAKVPFTSSEGKYVLLLKEQEPELIPEY